MWAHAQKCLIGGSTLFHVGGVRERKREGKNRNIKKER